ncbi:hypothetical protein RJ639_031935 [Escallonia herrerae]|uniref:Uncharacterized protein n=1 Tax=Escallonia herrerae TaxID=1293975 RepID=A0AA89BMY8_9ASTE|nr:hypothetical protein RJ639_031935 [Escallonia herrerae]
MVIKDRLGEFHIEIQLRLDDDPRLCMEDGLRWNTAEIVETQRVENGGNFRRKRESFREEQDVRIKIPNIFFEGPDTRSMPKPPDIPCSKDHGGRRDDSELVASRCDVGRRRGMLMFVLVSLGFDLAKLDYSGLGVVWWQAALHGPEKLELILLGIGEDNCRLLELMEFPVCFGLALGYGFGLGSGSKAEESKTAGDSLAQLGK